ncbi:MAG TPA: NAD(P)-binding domain-containing protein, partial [Phycisphaerae bacterium]
MIALIGAGPLGIEMAVALKNANLDYLHFEAGQIGATMAWWAPGTRWFSSTERISIAGVPLVTQGQEKATREEYLAYLRAVVEQFQLKIQTYTLVNGIRRAAGGAERQFALSLRSALHENAPEQFLAVDKIILANGGTATPNLLNVPGENLPHVSHYFQDPHAYFGKKVLIVGGRNSAVEAAMRCYRIGAQVHFSYYGTAVDAKDIKYWLYPEFSSLVKSGKIVGHFETRVREILPDRILLAKSGGGVGGSGGGEELPADFVLLLTGYRADMSLAMMAGVQLTGDQQLPIFNPDTMET